ncbi:MAG: SPOR domain-containing protein [Balneolaceae bacterium]|nr:SPOR domain-containing protein [Balneolaceae bacterium]
MKTILVYLLTAITLVSLLHACGPSEEEQQRQRQQEIQDSLARVRQQQLQQQRMDSIARAQARADSIKAAEQQRQQQRNQIQFNPDGNLAVQVEAWRSREKAQAQVSKWVDRGFENAYVVKHGNEETGDVWFRVRLGRVSSQDMANRIGSNIQEEYGERYWIATATRGG